MSDATTPSALDDPEVYRSLVEGIPAILYIDRPDDLSTNFYTSPQAVDLLGFTQEEWGTTQDLWVRQIHPDDRDRVIAENLRVNETGDKFSAEYRMIARDGRVVWIRDEAAPVFGDDGRPIHWRGFMLDITAEKAAEEQLRWSLDVLRRTIQQRRELAQRLESAQEQERRRIAADIHDDPIQVMSAVDVRLQMFMQGNRSATPDELAELQEIVHRSIERLRSMLFELRPTTLDRDGLVAAIRRYAEHTGAETGLKFVIEDELLEEPGRDLRASLYRIMQEAVMNVRKHAQASRVTVLIASTGGGVSVTVRDDGTGFDVGKLEAPRPGHIGLSTMIERAELVGGWCRVSSSEDGTTVECWLPFDDAGAEPLPA
ncbi:MAG: PAS domain-containing protein [Actinomycetota bacterium]|nr:PAS domain-containing protein [Actinomycetota bacterium]